jgi:pimeloyl-ACP methyl ester carboxylesterase
MESTYSDISAISRPTGAPPTQFLSVPGGVIAYDATGDGPLVICVPGMGDVRAEYRFLRPQLVTAGFRVATLDLRGHGESSVGWREHSKAAIGADLIALVQRLDAGPAYLIGTSYAAGAVVCAAVAVPSLVSGLVLIGPFVRDNRGNLAQKALLNALLLRPWGPTLWSSHLPTLYPSQRPPDFATYRTHLKATLREPGRIEAVRAMLNSPNAGVETRLESITAPTLVIMGAKDPDFHDPSGEAQWIADHVHGNALMVTDAGHYPHAECPNHVGPEIIRFLHGVGSRHVA